jgi:hypothetical protein
LGLFIFLLQGTVGLLLFRLMGMKGW